MAKPARVGFGSRIPFIVDADSGPLLGKAEVQAEKDRSWGYTGPSWRRSKPTLIARSGSSGRGRFAPHDEVSVILSRLVGDVPAGRAEAIYNGPDKRGLGVRITQFGRAGITVRNCNSNKGGSCLIRAFRNVRELCNTDHRLVVPPKCLGWFAVPAKPFI